MKYTKKFGLLIASAVAVFFTTQFLAAQIVGPPVFTPQMTVSPGFLTVTTGPTTVEDLTINGTCTGCVGAANFANPTGTIGLTAVNGTAVTGIRSDGAPALSQAIAPTWTATHIFSNATTAAWEAVGTNSAGAGIRTFQGNTNAAVDNRYWGARVNQTGDLRFGAWSDADFPANSETTTWLTVDRTGTTVDTIALAGTAITLNGVAASDFARLSVANTFTAATIELENAAPIFQVDETDAASNERNWLYRSSAGILAISTATDAAPTTAVANAITMDRTGTTVDSINLQATSVQKNGVEIATYETGSFTVNYGNACTTTPSETWDYIKVGNQVTIKLDAKSGFPCTGDVTSFSSGAVPAALIPPDNALSPMFGDGGCQDNGTVVQCSMSISGGLGLMAYGDCTGGGACNATGWQAAGNRSGFALGVTFTYSLDP